MLDASKYLYRILVERYHIKKEIGRGASSIVFYAEDMITKDESGSPLAVALKILDKDSNEYKINSKSFYIETRAVVGMPVSGSRRTPAGPSAVGIGGMPRRLRPPKQPVLATPVGA